MKSKFYPIIGPILVIIIWWAITKLNIFNSFLLPDPISVFGEFFRLIVSGEILKDVYATIYRVLISFVFSIIIGLPLGLLLGSSKKLYKSFEFLIDFFRSIPATAIFPLFLLFFGIEDSSKIGVAIFSSSLIILFNTAYGVINSSKLKTFAAKLMGANKFQIFSHISFWDSLPQTFVGIRTALSLSLIVIIVTEMFIGTNAGIGRRIIDFQYIYNIKGMYAMIIVTGVVGYLLNRLIIMIENKVVHWTGK